MKKKTNSKKKPRAEARHRFEQLLRRLESTNPEGLLAFKNAGLYPRKK